MAYNSRGYGMTTYRAVGDPFLGGLIKGAGKFIGGVAKTAGGIIGGPIGGVLQAGGGLLTGAPKAAQPPIVSRPFGGTLGIQTPVGFGGSLGVNVGAQRYTGVPIPMRSAPGGYPMMAPDLPPKGYHINKSDYFLKDGTYVPAGSRYVKNRRMNPANGRALRRSIRRAKSFDNLVKRNRKNLRSLARI